MQTPGQTADLAIRGGEIIDGTGAPRVRADLLIANGCIQAVVAPGAGQAQAQATIDATGLIVAPGFIDAHTHDDNFVMDPVWPHPKLSQGVTTVVTGNCGISAAPLPPGELPQPLDIIDTPRRRYPTFEAYLAALDAVSLAVNVAPLVGHIALRVLHMADLQREANAREVDAMARDCDRALRAGAFGLSTGVYYPPAAAATREELLGVADALAGRGVLAMHIRDEADRVEEAVAEALEIGAACGSQLVISHHKVVGARNRGRSVATLGTISRAAAHQRVCMDCYPYEASSTMLSPAKAAATEEVLITWSAPHPEAAGRQLRAIAADWGLGIAAAAQRLLPAGAIYFGMSQDDVDRILSHPLTMVASDGLPHDTRPHPRLWGSFPRVLGNHVRTRGLFPLEQAIHKMTGMPARVFGLAGRGAIRAGAAADLTLFDSNAISDRATYAEPALPAAGVHTVIVNGVVAMNQGQHEGGRAGRRLRPAHADEAARQG